MAAREISKIPEALFVVEYTKQQYNRYGQNATATPAPSTRIYNRPADVAKAVVDGNAQGSIFRYISAGTQEFEDLGPGARKAADGWTHGSDKRKAVIAYLREGVQAPSFTDIGDVEGFLNG